MTNRSHSFTIHTQQTAPAGSHPAMARLQQAVGALPNLARAMAESPVLLGAFADLRALVQSQGTFDAATSELLSLANAVANGCRYCTAIHSTFGLAAGLPAETVANVRTGGLPTDPSHRALVEFTRAVLATRGKVADTDFDAFLAAGFEPAQALEIIARAALSVMANYAGRLIAPEPDDAIAAQYAT
ncbi:MAG: carboxymuconolactone decarboxylase family protein [Planctomycetes bacterium]|nr:carboxymuconolactone decarboxylase family protein [Planctomycetota bacterium]